MCSSVEGRDVGFGCGRDAYHGEDFLEFIMVDHVEGSTEVDVE